MVEPKEQKLHRIAITGIIWREEAGVRKYLIIKRAPHKIWAGRWAPPGGGLEVGDYIHEPPDERNPEAPQWYGAVENALRRELREEVNLEVGAINYLLDIAAIRPDGIPLIVLSMYCAYKSGEVKLDEDASEFAWIIASEVGNYDLIKGIDHEIQLVEERLAKE